MAKPKNSEKTKGKRSKCNRGVKGGSIQAIVASKGGHKQDVRAARQKVHGQG